MSIEVIRTPEERFADLPDYPFAENHIDIDGIRVHYIVEGPADGEPILLLHGEPTWSYLYRHMLPPLAAAGLRVVAPDLPGFGKSDKPVNRTDYSYAAHVRWMKQFIDELDLQNVTLFGQDWGSLIGLRLAMENGRRFARIVLSNGGLPDGSRPMPEAFRSWRRFSQESPEFDIGRVIQGGTITELTSEVIAAYNAPFPDERFKAGARQFPALVPDSMDDPAGEANRSAWQQLMAWKKPFLTAFSDSDPITAGGERPFVKLVPGAQGQAHTTVAGAGHFVQEDKGTELATIIVAFITENPLPAD